MSVLINFKICDNVEECNGIAVCPTGTLSWNKKKKRIVVNNKKCISCGKCKKACEVGAIEVAKTKEKYDKIKKEINDDPRRVADLFVERYGAQPLYTPFFIAEKDFEVHVLKANKLTVVELFTNESIKCLLHSIQIKNLFKGTDIKYRKMEIKGGDEMFKKYKLSKMPALLFFKSSKLIGKIEGYYRDDEKEKIIKKISKVIANSRINE